MVSYLLFGLIYLMGLILFILPRSSIPYFEGSAPPVRLSKHALSLGLFAYGTMKIHGMARQWTGYGFILASCVLILGISLVRIYVEKGLSKDKDG